MRRELLKNTPRFGKFIGNGMKFKQFLNQISLYLDYTNKRRIKE